MKVLNTNFSYKYRSVAHKKMIQKNLFFNIHDNESAFIKSKLKLIKY